MKAKAKKAGGQRKWSSITRLVKESLREDESIKYDAIMRLVKRFFPESRFNERHWSWYKTSYRKGALKGVK